MKRTRIDLHDVAAWPNLVDAAGKAAKGKRSRPEVAAFFSRFDDSVDRLAKGILDGTMPRGIFSRFMIRDPKPRIIHAACFEDRVLHHAVVNLAGPVLDRALLDSVHACRVGKGHHAAVRQVQQHLRCHPWYVKIDVDAYFRSIDHALLLSLLERKFKGKEFLALLERIVGQHHDAPGKGLPIGSLTSQHFANFFLDGLDRFVQEQLPTRACLRYMDDSIWWCDDRQTAQETLRLARDWLAAERLLAVKENSQIGCSVHGTTFCGHRIKPGAVRLTRRRKRRYAQGRRLWEEAFVADLVDGLQLQQGHAAVHAAVGHADSCSWRRENLRRQPPPEA